MQGGLVISSSGFNSRVERADAYTSAAHLYFRAPATASAANNAFEPRPIVGAQTLVPQVLQVTAKPKIGPTVIEAVSINVINLLAFAGTHYRPMHVYL
jgi:hypothetical protein